MAPLKARKGDCVVGIFDDDDLEFIEQARKEANKFKPQELNEANVQAIFNRCLAKPETTEKVSSILYYKELGCEKEDLGVAFDKNALIANRKNIEYLYGQIASVHESQSVLKETDFAKTYSGHLWTEDNAPMMQLIYLGISEAVKLLTLFNAAADGTALYAPVTPTLSPKDPAFPAWWEAHKAEWEA